MLMSLFKQSLEKEGGLKGGVIKRAGGTSKKAGESSGGVGVGGG